VNRCEVVTARTISYHDRCAGSMVQQLRTERVIPSKVRYDLATNSFVLTGVTGRVIATVKDV
jgi:hypothetical protein